MGNVLSDYARRKKPVPMPRPKPGPGAGGPTQEQLRDMMRRNDPERFASLQRRGFDPMAGQEIAPPEAAFAGRAFAAVDPADAMSPHVMRAYSQPVDPLRELVAISAASPRGQAMRQQNALSDALLRQKIERIKNAPVPAETGDGDFSARRKLLDALLWATGQGGGMR